MDSRQVYIGALLLLGVLGVSACTEEQIQECMSYGISRAVCEAGGVVGGGGGGGGDNPPDVPQVGIE